MRLKEGFVLRTVAGQTVVVPSGDELNINIMITLNGTGRFLWEHLATDTDEAALASALLAEYDVDEATAKTAVEDFVAKLNHHEFLTE